MELNKKHIPQFKVKTTQGADLIFGEGSEKPTLLVLFTTWCDSCQTAAPAISKAFAHVEEKISLVGIGREHAADELDAWANKEGLAYQLVEDPNRDLFNKFAKMHVPRIYLIDTDGSVLYQDVNWHPFMLDDLRDHVDELMARL